MTSASITYDLGRDGWSSFKLTVDDEVVAVGPFGYCTDALGDLVRAALLVATSAFRADVQFDGEPREWRLILDEGWTPGLSLRVLSFADAAAGLPETEGELLFEAQVTADDFARAVQRAAQGVWDRYGASGYNDAWTGQRGFPLRALRALDAALSCDEPRAV